ncbi:MAG: response regulator transcription factor [Clostridium sp.]|nr:response regulator transcription factor [Clostridium sp.]
MFNSSPLGCLVVVDDDKNIADMLKFNLVEEGFSVRVHDIAAEVELESLVDACMVIVDAMKQPYTGMDFTRDIKAFRPTEALPVIICTESENEDIVLDAFDAGADDFVLKPFSLRELIARVKAVLRRRPRQGVGVHSPSSARAPLSVPSHNLQVDLSNQRVVEGGVVVPLTRTEYAILVFLIKHQNTFFTRDQICEEVWRDEAGSNSRIVDTNISRLRKKLGESGKYLINQYGKGYAFVDKL